MDGRLEKTNLPLSSNNSSIPSSNFIPEMESPFSLIRRNSSQRPKQIWAIGGGKGGAGKSLISSSLAISLARNSNKVVAIDLDLGGSNLHTTLGIDLPARTLTDFLYNPNADLNEIAVPTGIPHLNLISGAQDHIGVSNLGFEQKTRLLQSINTIDADYVLLDLGAGTNLYTVDFFLGADLGIIVALPEPTSIENAYRFIKSTYFRKLQVASTLDPIRPLIQNAMDGRGEHKIKTPADLFRESNHLYPEIGMHLKREIESFLPKLIINQTRTQADIDIGFSIKSVCRRYFGINMEYVGYLDYDSAVWQSVRRKRLLMLEFPNSKLVSNLERIVHYLIKRYSNTQTEIYAK